MLRMINNDIIYVQHNNGLYHDDEAQYEMYFSDCQKAVEYFETQKICDNCRFSQGSSAGPQFSFDDSGKITFHNIDCRYNPPTHWGFPSLRADAWCAKFEKR